MNIERIVKLIDSEILANSEKLKLSCDEKNYLYEVKCFLDSLQGR